MSHNRILGRAGRAVDISTSLQTDILNLYSRETVLQPGFPLSSVKEKVMFCISKCPTNWHCHWAGTIYGRKTKEWSFLQGEEFSWRLLWIYSLHNFVVLVQFASLSFSGMKNHKYIQLRQTDDFLPCLSLTSYIFHILSTEFHQSYRMHFKEWCRCMLGRNLMD